MKRSSRMTSMKRLSLFKNWFQNQILSKNLLWRQQEKRLANFWVKKFSHQIPESTSTLFLATNSATTKSYHSKKGSWKKRKVRNPGRWWRRKTLQGLSSLYEKMEMLCVFHQVEKKGSKKRKRGESRLKMRLGSSPGSQMGTVNSSRPSKNCFISSLTSNHWIIWNLWISS